MGTQDKVEKHTNALALAAFAARSSSDIVEGGVYELRIASRVVAKSGSDGNSRGLTCLAFSQTDHAKG